MAIQNKEKGFTLIEVLIAAVILCAIFPLTNYFLNSMRTNNTTEVQQTANYLCQKYMEDYKAKSKEELNPGTYNFDEEGLHITVQIERIPRKTRIPLPLTKGFASVRNPDPRS